jgi:hypothetical protein
MMIDNRHNLKFLGKNMNVSAKSVARAVTYCFCGFGSAAFAQVNPSAQMNAPSSIQAAIMAVTTENPRVAAGVPVTVQVDFNTKDVPKPWCGFQIDYGDGESEDVRVGFEKHQDVPLTFRHTYQDPGQYVIRLSGKSFIRGFRSSSPCDGTPKNLTIRVIGTSDASTNDDLLKAKQMLEAADEKLRELAAKEADLKLLEQRLERERTAQISKSQNPKIQSQKVETIGRPIQPAVIGPQPQSSPTTRRVEDPF